MTERLTAGLLCLFLLLSPLSVPATAEEADTPLSVAQGIVEWKKKDSGSPDGWLMNDAFLETAGSTAGDWYPIGLSRLGIDDRYEDYLAVLEDRVEARYRQPGRLSAAKATEWHRIILAVLAAGGDPTAFGTDENGQPINLLADGVYDRGKASPLGRQGINGMIWGLIALDSMRYEVPENACDTRESILAEILSAQLPNGGWAMNGNGADPDLTAMAIQALAPYYKGELDTRADVREAVDKALGFLSASQLPTGGFMSWGTENVESTDQVLIALCCLGIDPLRDARFIKEGHTLLWGILRYRQPDGGFAHSFSYDPQNPNAKPSQSNSMAGEQTLLAMAALYRLENGLSSLYDFRPEEAGAPISAVFSESDRQAVDTLPDPLTTEQYVTVTALLDKLTRSADFAEKAAYLQKLMAAKAQIAEIQAEIDSLNAVIRDKLYPFESISLWEKRTVDEIVKRYNALSEYDRAKIDGREDILKAKAQIDSLLRGVILSAILLLTAAVTAFFLIRRVRNRKEGAP